MSSTSPAITVVIPTYNREEVLIDSINDVLNGQTFKDLELLVIDQSLSHNPETETAIKYIGDDRFRYFRTSPPSVTVAKNFALKKARSPYVVFLDDDVRLDKNLVSIFLKTFNQKPDISAVAGQVLQAGFETQKQVLKFDEYGVTHGGYTAETADYTNAFPGGNCAVKVIDALSVGGFDTRYKGNAFREENDLSMRMYQAGQKIYYEPKASLVHLAAPYGGNRVQTHIYDNPGFYRNELFFTLHVVERRYRVEALRRKYREYCFSVRHFRAYRRRILFCLGLLAAVWRLYFGRSVEAKEIN